MHTDRYRTLQRNLNKLRKVYLPRSFSPTGSYSESTLEKVRAYKVLVHAEMEFYFEQVALDIAKIAFEKWERQQKTSPPLVALVAYYATDFPALPKSRTENNATKDINWRIKDAHRLYNKDVRDKNHGIKEENILSIFLPIGIEQSILDEQMLIALNSFGSERGEIAHKARNNTRTPLITTPDDALRNVQNIMNHIDPFDSHLAEYKKSIR